MEYKKQNKIAIFLCAVMLIGVGYAFLTANLGINGTTNVKNNTWSVHFVENSIVGKHLATVEGKVPTIKNDSNNLEIDFTADLDKPGDIYEFSVDITNDGTIDAMLGDYSKTPEELPVYLIYTATWDNDAEPEKYDALFVGDTLTLNVKLEYSTEITADQLPGEEVEPFSMTINLPYVQADDKANNVFNFSNDDWATIQRVVSKNPKAYEVGSTKEITLEGEGDLANTFTVRVANNTRPSECSTEGFSQTACGFVVEFADIITKHNMNPSGEYKGKLYSYGWNVDGYPASSMYTYLKNDVYNAIPEEVRNVMVDTKVVSGHGSTEGEENFVSIDKLYLLSPVEVWGTGGGANIDTSTGSSRQLDNYKSMGVTSSSYSGAIKQYNGSGNTWWLRSATSNDVSSFLIVVSDGDWNHNAAINTRGVSPAFRIA